MAVLFLSVFACDLPSVLPRVFVCIRSCALCLCLFALLLCPLLVLSARDVCSSRALPALFFRSFALSALSALAYDLMLLSVPALMLLLSRALCLLRPCPCLLCSSFFLPRCSRCPSVLSSRFFLSCLLSFLRFFPVWVFVSFLPVLKQPTVKGLFSFFFTLPALFASFGPVFMRSCGMALQNRFSALFDPAPLSPFSPLACPPPCSPLFRFLCLRSFPTRLAPLLLSCVCVFVWRLGVLLWSVDFFWR